MQLTRHGEALHGRRGVRVSCYAVQSVPCAKKQSDAGSRFNAHTCWAGWDGRKGRAGRSVVPGLGRVGFFMTGANLVVDGGYTAM
ncbi:MAG: hypothetical protein H7A44_13115 [Opitutaceae bacterium]|nr:hypothetical protein [Opitutaceae bacterium]